MGLTVPGTAATVFFVAFRVDPFATAAGPTVYTKHDRFRRATTATFTTDLSLPPAALAISMRIILFQAAISASSSVLSVEDCRFTSTQDHVTTIRLHAGTSYVHTP